MPKSIASQRIAKQRIGGRPIATRFGLTDLQGPFQYAPGASYTFTTPKSGHWKFVAWSAGSKTGGTYAGCSGAYGEITKYLATTQTVTIKVGPEDGTNSTNTIITFPDGTVATCVNAAVDTPGTASGFDYSLAGSLGGATGTSANGADGLGTGGGGGGVGSGTTAGGAGAPARLPFRGGRGGGFRTGIGNFHRAASPGAGGSDATTLDADVAGVGLVLAYLVRE